MRVKDVMSKTLITATPDLTLADAISRMIGARISGLPVVDGDGCIVGILSESDLLHRSELGTTKRRRRWLQWLIEPGALAEDYAKANGHYVHEAMTCNVQTIDESASLGDVAEVMERHHIKRLPVLRDGELVGIVTRGDLVRALAGFLAPAYEDVINSDREICKAIRSELNRQSWGPRTLVDIAAKDGVVELRGSIFDERQREAIRVAAENVPGVKAVHDHMVWVDPLSAIVVLSREDSIEPRKG